MSGRTVELEALQEASVALERYIQDVDESVSRLRTNVQHCQENMEADQYSTKAVTRLQDGLSKIQNALANAQDTRGRIQRKIQEIEESATILG